MCRRQALWLHRIAIASFLWPFVRSQTCAPFVQSPRSVIVTPGEAVTLSCDYPGSYVEAWDKGKFHVSLSSPSSACNCQLTSNGSASVLVFPNVTDMDFDEYSCNAQIGPGVTCTAVANISKAVPAVLTAVGSSLQTADQGSTVTFSVTLTNPGLPLADVVWTKDGVTLNNTSNMAVTNTTLRLSNIQPGDRGQYVVTATNKAGSSNVTFSLFVNFLAVNVTTKALASTVQLTCTAQGYPSIDSIMWSNVVPQSYTGGMDGNNAYTYSIVITVPSDCSQAYTCTVKRQTQIVTTVVPICELVLSLLPVGHDGVFLSWSMVQGGYTMYTVTYGSVVRTVPCQTSLCNTTIDGLGTGVMYNFNLTSGVNTASAYITVGSGLSSIATVNVSQSGLVYWSVVPGATGYLVYVNKDTPNAYTLNVTSGNSTTITADCSMPTSTAQVRAYNATALSKLSSVVTLLSTCAPVVKPVGFTSIFLEWTAPNGSTSDYIITFMAASSSVTIRTGPLHCATKCNYTLTGLTTGTTYIITVVEVTSQQPVASGLKVSVGSGLGAVTGVVVTPSDNSAVVQWDVVPNAVGYLIYVNETSSGSPYIINTTGTKVNVAITCGLKYTFAVQAYNNNVGFSDVSQQVQLAGCKNPISIPQELIIGVVVVAVLVLVATIFCGLGVWYACNSGSKDQGDVRSVSSIEGIPTTIQESNLSRDDPGSPTPVPRSCNYLRSHKITWNNTDHSNTLRDLDRGGISV